MALSNPAVLPWWSGLRAASAQAAGLHLATQQLGLGGQSYRQPGTLQRGCRQLDAALQRSSLSMFVRATGSQATTRQTAGWGLATQQPCHCGQGSGQPWAQALGNATTLQWLQVAEQQPGRQLDRAWQSSKLAMVVKVPGSLGQRLLDCTWQRSSPSMLVRATGSQATTRQTAGWGLATQQPCHCGQGYGQPWAQALGNATTLQWLQVARQQPGRQLDGGWQPDHGVQG